MPHYKRRLASWRRFARCFPLLAIFFLKNGSVHKKSMEPDHLRAALALDYDCGKMERQVDEIQLHIIGWRRLDSLQQLMSQLESSNYDEWEFSIPLYIHLDGGARQEVITAADGFLWTHGRKIIDKRSLNVGLREMWLSSIGAAAKAAGDNSLMVVFEDDMVVSLDYFQWILATIDAYGRNIHCRDSNLMGFSLSPIRIEELRKPFTRWSSRVALGYNHTAYLSVVPSSWGAVYWSDRWNEFSAFVHSRMKPPYYDIQSEMLVEGGKYNYDTLRLTPEEFYIPDSRSNVWPKSWKRFMIDWMYARGLVMLYPCFPEEKGLASTLALPGEHVSSSTAKNPRVADLQLSVDREMLNIVLPPYDKLPVLGLHLQPTTRENLALDGEKFLLSVRAKCTRCDELLRLWSRSNVLPKDPPSTCTPDLFMPTSSAKFQQHTVANTSVAGIRYLLYEPQYGGNNQLLAMTEALRWAASLGRHLVIPPLFLPRVSEFEKPYAEWPVTNKFFRFISSDKQPVSFQEWVKLSIPVQRMLRISREAVFDKTTYHLTDEILNQTIPTTNLRHLFDKETRNSPLTPKNVNELLGGCDDEVLLFEGMFFANLKTGKDKWVEMVESIRPSDFTVKILENVKAKLKKEKFLQGEYACFHVRAGDFTSMCGSVKKKSLESSGNSFDYWKSLLEEGFKCSLLHEEIVNAISALGLPAFIMSNDDTTSIEEDPKVTRGVISSGWIYQSIIELSPAGTSEGDLDILSLIIEQEICAEAKFSILNVFSTVSKRMEIMRRSRGQSSFYWSEKLMYEIINLDSP